MTLFGKSIESPDEPFVSGLKGAYYMENEIVEALPDLIETARSSQLKQALSSHLEETKGQVERLLQVFEMHGVIRFPRDRFALRGNDRR
jgi:ferritin-like metal-binding protein YciE